MTRRVLVSAAALFVTLMASIVPAGAQPNHKFPLTLDCGAAGSRTVMVFSNGRSPGLDVAGNSVFIPTSVDFTGTFYPADGSDPVVADEEHWTKPGTLTAISTISCTFSFTDTFDEGTFVGVGEVSGFQTPRG